MDSNACQILIYIFQHVEVGRRTSFHVWKRGEYDHIAGQQNILKNIEKEESYIVL